MADFAQILIRAKDETKGAFDSAARNMRGLEAGASKLKGLLGTIGIGAGLSAAGFAAFAKQGIDAADALNDMSQRLGVSVKDLASFKLAAEQSGTSLEGVGKAIGKLNRSIGEAERGNKIIAQALRDMGVTAKEPKEAFFQLADAVKRIEDPTKRAALLSQVLGKSYEELLPLLSQGSDELRRSAAASESFADAMAKLAPDADKFNDQLAQLKINAAGVAAGLLTQVVPSLNEYLGALQKVVREGTAMEKLGFFTLGFIPAHILDEQATSADELGKRIASYRQRIAELKEEGKDASVEIATMNKLMAKQVEILNAPPKRPGAGAIDTSAATGRGRATGTKTDPLSGLLGSTDIGRTQEYNRLLGLLDARFAGGKKNAELYAQAVEKLNEQFGKSQVDVFGSGSFKTTDKATADFISQQQDAINALNSEMAQDGVRAAQEYESALASLLGDTTIAKTEALQESIDVLNRAFFDGTIGVEQYDQAIANLTEGSATGLEKTKSLAEDLGLTFTSALEDAIVTGESFSDMLKGLEQDIARLIVRKTITEPLMNVDWGAMLGALIPSANGNAFSGVPGLSAYSGTVVSKPTLFPFAAGSGLMGEAGPEAILPLKRGPNGKLGVEGGGSAVQVNVINNASGTQATATEREDNGVRIVDVMVEQVEGAMSRRLGRGEGLAPVMERRYGLNPAGGAY